MSGNRENIKVICRLRPINNKEKETGITIHFVNEHYDEGTIIFQKSIEIEMDDTPDSIVEKIHQLEYENYPKVIEKVMLKDEC